MGLLLFILLIVGLCSFFIARAVYNSQIRNQYKNPGVTATIVFILSFTIIGAAILFLIFNNIMFKR